MFGVRALGAATMIVLLGACGTEPVSDSPLNTYPTDTASPTTAAPVTTTTDTLQPTEVVMLAKDQPFSGSFRYDVLAPDRSGLLPVVVLIHDFDGRTDIETLATSLAEDAIVIVPTYAGPARNGRFPGPLTVTACALALAGDSSVYGGDPSNVTVFGIGFGALAAYIAANTGDLYLSPECDFKTPVVPSHFIGLGGTWDPTALASQAPDAMAAFMGSSPTNGPATWLLIDPYQYTDPTVTRITLLQGANDLDQAAADGFAAHLTDVGVVPSSVVIEGQTSRSATTNAIDELKIHVLD